MEIEEEFVHDGLPVTYKFRPGTEDRRHLIVIFSGFRPKGRPYDFDRVASQGLRSNILWIRDLFDGEHAYYIKNRRGYAVADAVAALVDEFRTKLGLDKEHCTLVGFSKGGAGALYHSLAYDYPNLLMTVPRMHIGTGNIKTRPHLVEAMAGSRSAEAVRELDEILPDLLKRDTNLDRNIYLISSARDGQFKTEISPFLETFGKFENFNFIKSNSPLVTRHVDVTPYNVPMVISILHALGEGLRPRFGSVENGAGAFNGQRPGPTLKDISERREIVAGLDSLAVLDGALMASGFILSKGTPVPVGTDREVSVRLDSADGSYLIPLLPAEDRKLSYRHFEHEFCDYTQAMFASSGSAHDSLEALETGFHDVSLQVNHGGHDYRSESLQLPKKTVTAAHKGSLYQFREINGSVVMVKRPDIGPAPVGTVLSLKKHWATGKTLHVEGEFIVPGQPVPTFDSVSYFLSFQPQNADCSSHTRRLATGSRRKGSPAIGDPFLDFSKGYFATKKYAGIEISGLEPGQYELWITAEYANAAVVSRPLNLILSVGVDGDLSLKMDTTGQENTRVREVPSVPLARRIARRSWRMVKQSREQLKKR